MAEKKNRYEYEDVPQDVRDYLRYMSTVNNRSPRTIDGYHIDLRTFFRYLYGVRNPQCAQAFEDRNISGLDRAFIAAITKEEIFDYLYYLKEERRNAPAARARKLSSIKGFFTFMTVKTDRLPFDPARDVSVPAQRKTMPKYLSLEESMELLKNIQSGFYTRDYCILTLFLNCGMRLSELVGINLGDFKEGTVRIVGKGDKERLVYLNKACEMALKDYLEERASLPRLVDKNALFISKRTGRRMSNRRVEQVVEQCLKTAGLEGRGYSVHKLRHTAMLMRPPPKSTPTSTPSGCRKPCGPRLFPSCILSRKARTSQSSRKPKTWQSRTARPQGRMARMEFSKYTRINLF